MVKGQDQTTPLRKGTQETILNILSTVCTFCLVKLKILAGLTPKEASEARGLLQAVFALCNSNLKCKNNTLCSCKAWDPRGKTKESKACASSRFQGRGKTRSKFTPTPKEPLNRGEVSSGSSPRAQISFQ
jgi:hypothetical protein